MIQISQKELITLAYKGLETMQQELELKKQALGEMFVSIINEENAAAKAAAEQANAQAEPITKGTENEKQESTKEPAKTEKKK